MEVKGLLGGDMVAYFVETYKFIDRQHGLFCEVTYDPEYTQKGMLEKIVTKHRSMRDQLTIVI